jgi:hypothetical protein
MVERYSGIVPERQLCDNITKKIWLYNELNAVGIVPDNELYWPVKIHKFVKAPMDSGIVPVK